MSKMTQIPIPDSVHNWILNFLADRKHFTSFQSTTSSTASINAGVVQGSAIGPAAFIICASDLLPSSPGNKSLKYADDFYLIVPASNTSTIPIELAHLSSWAAANNLNLNPSKSNELIIKKPRSRVSDPPPIPGLPRVSSLKILGVTINSKLCVTEHVDNLVGKAGQNMFALRVLKTNGLAAKLLNSVLSATLLFSLTYASQAWWGFASQQEISRIQSALNRAHRWGLCNTPAPPSFLALCQKADSTLFTQTCTNKHHVLHPLLPPLRQSTYNLLPRPHPYTLPSNTHLQQQNFLTRMLYKDSF